VLKEFAEQLESRHQEKGRLENSRWNKSFAIQEDDLSSEARFFFNTALATLRDIVRTKFHNCVFCKFRDKN